MKRLLLTILLLTAAASAQRYDSFASTITSASGISNLMQVIPAAKITVCSFPGTGGVPCTNLTTTFTDQTLTTGCSTSTQVVLQGTSTCVANADTLGNFGFWVPAGFYQYCISASNVSGQCYNIVVTSTGACNLQSVNANSVVFLNGTSNCTTDANFNYFTVGSGSQLILKSSGTGTSAIQINGNTSGSMNWNVTTTGLISLLSNQSSLALGVDRDTALTPINFSRFRNGTGSGTGILQTSDGFEFSGAGDASGAGSAAGFVVKNAASSLNASPGASNSLTAGNSVGTTASTSPAGDNTIQSGNYVGANNNRGGDINLTTGNSAGTGRGGNLNVTLGTGTPNGQFLINGTAFPQPTGTVVSLTTNSGTAIGASDTTWITKAVTMPASGCPCRVIASFGAYFTATNSGTATFWLSDGTTNFATCRTLTNTAGGNAPGCGASSISPSTYANNAAITFTGHGWDDATGGITTAAPPFGSAQVPWLSLIVITSN